MVEESGCRGIGLSLDWSLRSHSGLMDLYFGDEMTSESELGRGLARRGVVERMRLGGGSLRNSSLRTWVRFLPRQMPEE